MNLKVKFYKNKEYLGLRRAFIWSDKIRKIEGGQLFYFFYGDDISTRYFVGILKYCRIEKKKLLDYKTQIIGLLEISENGHKMQILGKDHFYRKRFTMAHLLGWFVWHKKKVIERGGIVMVDQNYKSYFKA
jgi:hypothetical protein